MKQFAVVFLAAVCLTGSWGSDVSPVEKVIQMLADLQAQVINEGKAEATTYDKFACFCKDMTNEKSEAITEGETRKEELTGTIGDLTARREDLDKQIADFTKTIADLTKEIDDATKKREEELATYEKNNHDLVGAIEALDGAIGALKASKGQVEGASLLAVKGVMKTVSKAIVMADALGLGNPGQHKALAVLLQQPDVPVSDYDFQSGHIVEMLEDLKKSFVDQKDGADSENVAAQAEHDKLVQSLTMERKSAEGDLEQAKEDKGKVMDEIAQNQQDLTTCIATLRDDQAYLLDLTEKCEAKSKEWDQRSKMREEELTALTQALAIIKGTVSEKTTEKTIRFVERASSVQPHSASVDADSDLEEDEEEDVSFLQLEQPKTKLSTLVKSMTQSRDFLEAQSPREKAIALLRTRGEELHSKVLSTLATKMQKDVFAKIKKLIQELIERLLQEAANEASHKGWCDEAMGKAKQQRGLKAEKIKKLNTEMEGQEAKRDKLEEEIKVLTTEIAELTDALSKATAQREEESAENAATISEAEEGKDAVEMAIDVLQKFYGKAAKGKVELIQGVDDDIPDAGFEGAYKGKQAESGGILGMLEVIKSDFERTMKETAAAEKKAQQEFIEFERTTKVSLAQKTTAKETKETELDNVKNAHNENMDDLIATQDLFDKALQELEELKPACVDTGMSYEERVARREQEIEALKEALCILDKEGPVQTEGC